MPAWDLFSNRERRASGQHPDVLQYDRVPEQLRNQIFRIWRTASQTKDRGRYFWDQVEDIICREHGLASLATMSDSFANCAFFLRVGQDLAIWLDLVELSFRFMLDSYGDYHYTVLNSVYGVTQTADDAIAELNVRFRESGFGYRFETDRLIRVDSELVHAEVTRPALNFLGDPRFSGANEEFLQAYAHHRAGEFRDAITDANNAFESILKTICDLKHWAYPKGARASDLLKVVRKNGLLPDYLDNSFDQLVATLASGLPVVRNNEGGHGQGPVPAETPEYIASYALHLAASNILFLKEAAAL